MRFYDPGLWTERWFRLLPADSKLIYLFLLGMADIAGFWEVDHDAIRFYTGLTPRHLQRAWEGLSSILVSNGRYVWIPDFIIRQRNWPLKPENKAHQGIIARLEARKDFSPLILKLLSGEGLPSPYEGPEKGLFSPTSISISKSKDIHSNTDSSNNKKERKRNIKEKERKPEDELIDYLNRQTNSRFRYSETSRRPFRARLNDHATPNDIRLVIDYLTARWMGDPEMEPYLRPETICRASKFEGYLNAAIKWAENGRSALNKNGKLAKDLEAARRFAQGAKGDSGSMGDVL